MGMHGKSPCLISDTRLHQVEFHGVKVRELTTNVIIESMYTQYNAKQNEYKFLDLLIDHQNDEKTIVRGWLLREDHEV